MRNSGEVLMSLGLMVIAAGAVVISFTEGWPFKTALFPVVIGIPVFFMAVAVLGQKLLGREEGAAKRQIIDFKLSEDSDQALSIRRTLLAFAWVIGFFFLILL